MYVYHLILFPPKLPKQTNREQIISSIANISLTCPWDIRVPQMPTFGKVLSRQSDPSLGVNMQDKDPERGAILGMRVQCKVRAEHGICRSGVRCELSTGSAFTKGVTPLVRSQKNSQLDFFLNIEDKNKIVVYKLRYVFVCLFGCIW